MGIVVPKVIFVANHEPPLKDGYYTFDLAHTLTYGTESRTFKKNHTFAVTGERFSIKNNIIHKLFPPANSQGHFDNVLPHVVLTRRTLPWERIADTTAKNSSWLAVLVFTTSDAPTPVSSQLTSLYPSTAPDGGGTLPSDTYSYGSPLKTSDYFLQYGEKTTDTCVYIDIPQNQFALFAPSLADLAWNAHARTLIHGDGSDPQHYATVVASRLPTPGATCTAHLVSFEGLGDQLPKDDGTYATPPSWTKIRLVSLKSWSFHVAALEASFANLLQGLNGGIDASGTEVSDSQIRVPAGYKPVAAAGLKLLQLPFDSGYSILAGKDGIAGKKYWYRGPFVPSIIKPPAADSTWTDNPLPATSTNDLATKVPTQPSQDASYAAAWQLGRLLALSDRSFASAQISWKRDVRLALNTKLGQANRLASGSRADYAKMMRAAIASTNQITSMLGTSLSSTGTDNTLAIPQTLVDWLGRLALLEGIPVNYLIPDVCMVASESLKFFTVDPRWVACLLDGAWSLDRQPAKHWAFDVAYQPWRQFLDGSLRTSSAPGVRTWPVCGMLLNSRLIPDYWPGIKFLPTPTAANVLREDNLGPSTMLILFDQALSALEIRQPPESMHFGFEIDSDGNLRKALRYVEIGETLYPRGGTGVRPGMPAPAANGLTTIPQRIPYLVQMDKLASAMAQALYVTDITTFTAAEFALELVESVAAATFDIPNGG